MQIALIAQDDKKELMAQLCIAYCGILAKHSLCSTATTGNFIKDATGLEIEMFLPGAGGGTEQIASRIAYDEIDLLLYFRDATDEFDSEDVRHVQHSLGNESCYCGSLDPCFGSRRSGLAKEFEIIYTR